MKWIINKLNSYFKSFMQDNPDCPPGHDIPVHAVVMPRDQHSISRTRISPNALKVLYRLRHEGYAAFLVGGGVRDLLLGREPKDFDVVTDAKPEQIRRCFRNAILVGKRFRLAHILFKGEIIEVSTFRAHKSPDFDEERSTAEGMILEDNRYGTFAEDASRRDFTVNALYYNIADFSVIDCHEGLTDLKQGLLRIIGDPEQRYREDPVRMLRAARLAAKLGFRIHEDTEKPIFTLGHLLSQVPPARLFAETEKLFLTGLAVQSYKTLRHYQLFKYIFPLTEVTLSDERYEVANKFVSIALADTDERVAQQKPANFSFLMAVMLWHPLQTRMQRYLAKEYSLSQAFERASSEMLIEQTQILAIPKRFYSIIREIWLLQERLKNRSKNRIRRILSQPRFRGAFDFLRLRAESGEPVEDIVKFWQRYYDQESSEAYQKRPRKNPAAKRHKHWNHPNKKPSSGAV